MDICEWSPGWCVYGSPALGERTRDVALVTREIINPSATLVAEHFQLYGRGTTSGLNAAESQLETANLCVEAAAIKLHEAELSWKRTIWKKAQRELLVCNHQLAAAENSRR